MARHTVHFHCGMRWAAMALALFVAVLLMAAPADAFAQSGALPTAASPAATGAAPTGLTVSINGGFGEDRDQISSVLQILALLTILTLAPAMLIMLTSFTRIVIVLGFVRRAMGTQEVPPTQVIIGLSLFLTFFVMAPTWTQVHSQAMRPYFDNEITLLEALDRAEVPTRDFLFANTRKADLRLFLSISGVSQPMTRDDVPTYVLVPAFMVSELQTAFLIGFIIYIPFLIIDMVVASTLMSMGMMMLPPVFVSLPFKIIMFVLADGWYLLIQELVAGFR